MPTEEEGGDVVGGIFVVVYVCVCMNGVGCMGPRKSDRSVFFRRPYGVRGWEPDNSSNRRSIVYGNG